jgi:hypothetical protein
MALDRPARVIGFPFINIFFVGRTAIPPRRILMAKHATIRLKGLKVATPIAADAVPVDLVPPDGPAGNPSITLELEGVGPVCTAVLNGKSYRRMLKALAERGPEGVTILLQGTLRPGPDGLPVLEGAGISAVPRSPAAPAEGGGA